MPRTCRANYTGVAHAEAFERYDSDPDGWPYPRGIARPYPRGIAEGEIVT